MLPIVRPQTDGSADSRSAISASTYASSGKASRAPGTFSSGRHSCELKSQYGHLRTHHGICT